MKWSGSTLVTLVVLAIILVIFPLVSIYYLNKGLDYRRSQLDKLETLGRPALLQAQNAGGFTLDSQSMMGHITVFADERLSCDPSRVTVEEYVQKFVNYDNFKFVTLTDQACTQAFEAMYAAPKKANPALVQQFDDIAKEIGLANAVILTDRRAQMRKVYDLTVLEDVEALVAHTAVLLPPKKNRD